MERAGGDTYGDEEAGEGRRVFYRRTSEEAWPRFMASRAPFATRIEVKVEARKSNVVLDVDRLTVSRRPGVASAPYCLVLGH